MTHDRLSLMFQWQSELMKLLGVDNGAQHSSNFTTSQFEAAVGAMVEAAEIVDVINTNSKPWKTMTKGVALERVLDEMVDVLFFLLELFHLVFGNNPDILIHAFYKKQLIVKARWLSTQLSPQMVFDALSRVTIGLTLKHPSHTNDGAFIVFSELLRQIPSISEKENHKAFSEDMSKFVKDHYYDTRNSSSIPPIR